MFFRTPRGKNNLRRPAVNSSGHRRFTAYITVVVVLIVLAATISWEMCVRSIGYRPH
jgi:hypothetical protein